MPQPTVQARPRVHHFVEGLPRAARWIDLGAGGRCLRADVVRVDSGFGQPVDVLADAHRLPFGEASLQAVVTTGTLEHVREPAVVLREVRRVLAREGLLYVEVPFLQGYHADPDDYWRFTENGLRLLLQQSGYDVRDSGSHMGPFSAVSWILSEVVASAFGAGRLHKLGLLLGRCLVWPLKFLDFPAMALPATGRVASGVWAIGQKGQNRNFAPRSGSD